MRQLPFVVALGLGVVLGACFACRPDPGPPLEDGRFASFGDEPDTLAGVPVDSAIELELAGDTAIVTFMSEGQAVEQRYRVTHIDDGAE